MTASAPYPVLKCNTPHPDFFIVDLSPVFEDYGRRTEAYQLYSFFPLQEIIQTMLRFDIYTSDSEVIYNELAVRYQNHMDLLDYDEVTEFFTHLQNSIDEMVKHRVPPQFDSGVYVFSRWIGPTTLILQKHG